MLMKNVFFMLFLLTGIGIGITSYLFFRAYDSCQKLEKVSKNFILNTSIAEDFSHFVSNPDAVTHLESMLAGRVFRYSEFHNHLSIDLNVLGIPPDVAALKVITDRNDNRFVQPYEIKKIGVGYARGYLMFEKEQSKEQSVENPKLLFESTPHVDCELRELRWQFTN